MSVATEFAPRVTIPARARAAMPAATSPAAIPAAATMPAAPARLATVSVLRPPAVDRLPVRLTRRGVAVLAAAVVVLGLALVWVARLSAPAATVPVPVQAHVVTVHEGDTLWSIAARVAPAVDPRAEVDRLQRRNHLAGADLVPGQQLRVP